MEMAYQSALEDSLIILKAIRPRMENLIVIHNLQNKAYEELRKESQLQKTVFEFEMDNCQTERSKATKVKIWRRIKDISLGVLIGATVTTIAAIK